MTTSESRRLSEDQHWIDRLPLSVALCMVFACAMLVPAAYAALTEDYASGRPFLYGSVIFLIISVLIGVAAQTRPKENESRALLLTLLAAFLLLPLALALPVMEAVPDLSFRNAYFEMVSSITTTGATVFDLPERAPPTVHLWRAEVAWLGGLLIWVSAISILAPMRLGGIEVVLTQADLGRNANLGRSVIFAYRMRHIWRHTQTLAPIYAGLTLLLWISLMLAGEDPFVAICHAMSTLSTSGITPLAGFEDAQSGRIGELLVAVFLVFALSRSMFARDMPVPLERKRWQDPELRLAAVIVLLVPVTMFIHHFVATIEIERTVSPLASLRAYWGGTFTSLSFLSTTGFVSGDWAEARNWSGLTTPGLILMGLALVGGGVATTAGGVKLLRVYALYKHGRYEMARLVHPSLVANPGHRSRRIGLDSAFIAWLFFMIFGLTVAAVMIALSLTGIDFETAMVLTVATLTTTGPLTGIAGDSPVFLAQIPAGAQLVLCAAMALGRLETLAIVALLNPEFWR